LEVLLKSKKKRNPEENNQTKSKMLNFERNSTNLKKRKGGKRESSQFHSKGEGSSKLWVGCSTGKKEGAVTRERKRVGY